MCLDLGHVPCTFSLAENLQGLSWRLGLISSRDPWGRPLPPEARWAPSWQMAESGPSGEAAGSIWDASTHWVPVWVLACAGLRL